jgi:hypothetical protein
VAAVWAVAATAIAVAAFVAASGDEGEDQRLQSAASEVRRTQRNLNGRLEDIQQRANRAIQREEFAGFARLSKQLEAAFKRQQRAIGGLKRQATNLEESVTSLEESVAELEASGTDDAAP